jgi:hypothetical protein
MKITTLKLSSLAAIALIAASVISCSPPEEVEQTTLISKMTVSNEDTADGLPKTAGDAHGGKYFSHTDSANMYGCGTVYALPDSLVQKTVRVKVNMWVRQGDNNPKNQFAVSLEAPDKTIIKWSEIVTQKHVTEMNKWVNVIDSVTIPGDMVNKAGLILKMFALNPEGTSYMDIDDVDISVYKVEKKVIE